MTATPPLIGIVPAAPSRCRRPRRLDKGSDLAAARRNFISRLPADHSELKRDLYTANFVFLFKSRVPNELIPINALGLTITYFREDEAFK
jgi:hypothetical protein